MQTRGSDGPWHLAITPALKFLYRTTNNQTADFFTSAGGEVMLQSKRGGNDFHGSAYEYFQSRLFNANTWDNNRIGTTFYAQFFNALNHMQFNDPGQYGTAGLDLQAPHSFGVLNSQFGDLRHIDLGLRVFF